MVLFVPNSQPWNEVVWCQSCSWFSEAGIGITDDDIDMILGKRSDGCYGY